MKLIKEAEVLELKTVEYFGLQIEVPVTAKYITVQADGYLIVWMDVMKPFIWQAYYPGGEDSWTGEAFEFDAGRVDLEGMNWKDTLKEV